MSINIGSPGNNNEFLQFKRWKEGDAPPRDRKWELVRMTAVLTLHLLVSITLDLRIEM